jgi:hypothetical protein
MITIDCEEDLRNIIKIQSLVRARYTRYKLYQNKDNMSIDLIKRLLDKYIEVCQLYDEINIHLNKKKCRKPNFPSEISENLVKFAFQRKYNITPCWDTKKGDLIINLLNFNKRLEIKGFTSFGPSSFGPTESWDYIYFVDAMDIMNKNFKIYEIRLSQNNKVWKNLKMNTKETYEDQCLQKRRPRICFNELLKQLKNEYYSIIFDGNIDLL